METTNNNKWSLIITLQIICIVIVLFGMVVLYDAIYKLRETRTQITTVPGEQILPLIATATTSTVVTTQNNSVTETTTYTFDQTGTFVSNPGAGANAWYLFYNTPQQLGKVTQLVFSNKSICLDTDQKVVSCSLGTAFVSGNQVRVIGYETGNSVTVGTLLKLTK